jgi:hypothetical protein
MRNWLGMVCTLVAMGSSQLIASQALAYDIYDFNVADRNIRRELADLSMNSQFTIQTFIGRDPRTDKVSCTLSYDEEREVKVREPDPRNPKKSVSVKKKFKTGKRISVTAEDKDCFPDYLAKAFPDTHYEISNVVEKPAGPVLTLLRHFIQRSPQATALDQLEQTAIRREDLDCYVTQMQAYYHALMMMSAEQKANLRQQRTQFRFTLLVGDRYDRTISVNRTKKVPENGYIVLEHQVGITAALNPESGACAHFSAKEIYEAYLR